MAAEPQISPSRRIASADFLPLLTWLPVLLGLAVMFIPSFVDLFKGIGSALLLIIGVDSLLQATVHVRRKFKPQKVGAGGTAA